MCTLTLLRAPWHEPWDGDAPSWRVAFSRDERRDRPRALAPRAVTIGSQWMVAPVDPVAGGTWIAATSAGLVFALLNEYDQQAPASSTPPESRGLVIPAVAGARSRGDAVRALRELDAGRFLPFRILVADAEGASELVSDGRRLQACSDIAGPRLMRTSSAVDAGRVIACRTALFARVVPHASKSAQDAFHAWRWPGETALGVSMSRPDACTVSITTLDVFATHVHVGYRPLTGTGAAAVTDPAVAS